jgi:FAD/FMN-containing dehydrogenase/Fe-S oxidoreductase
MNFHIKSASRNDPAEDVREVLAQRLKRETEGEALFDSGSRGRYSTDASIYQIEPVGAFIPKHERDIATAIQIARELGVPILPRGAGTSQCGQATGAALVIDNSKYFRALRNLDVANGRVTVQPGMVLDQLNTILKPHGLWYPVDISTGAQATLGGMAGNNSCGSRSIAYGNMVHNVAGISAWLSDGSLIEFGPLATLNVRGQAIAEFVKGLARRLEPEIKARWPKVMRRVGGYNLDIFDNQSTRAYTQDGSVNLAHLLVGSEGTLAYTRELTLALSPLPAGKVLGVVNFATFHDAMESAQHIVKLGPTAVELVDRIMVDLSLANPAFRPVIETALIGRPAAILLVEFAGEDVHALRRKLDDLDALMADLGIPGSVVKLNDEREQARLWEVRKAGLNIMMSLKGDGKPVSFIEDCAVPLAHLAEYTAALTDIFARHGTQGTWYAHASVGTLHVRPILDMREQGAAKMRRIAEEASVLVRKYKGAYSGEHGDGLCRGEWIEWQFGPAIYEAFRAIKQHLDPANLFNPHRIVDPPRMDDPALLRFAPATAPRPYRTIALTPVLDWSSWNVKNEPLTQMLSAPGTGGDPSGGFAKAVEMCNNNGHCRKFDAGTMCPSYRVTRDEQHLTRGRANSLRLALSGQLGRDAFTGTEMYETMDLCVSCKGCRRECPTGIDMAKMKIEFLAHYKRRHGFTLKDRLIAYLPQYAAAASRLSWLFNLRDTLPGGAWLSERLAGFSAQRPLPRWRRNTFWQSRKDTPDASAEQCIDIGRRSGKAAVLFVDTFNGTFETENAAAALRVLQAAGYTVHVLTRDRGHFCCGRTYLAAGMVDAARKKAAALIDALAPFAEASVPIVGLEPSCLLTLRDEALAMNLGERAELVSRHALMFEEFVAREASAGRFRLQLRQAEAPILLHGHCHQKAFGTVDATLQVLKLIPLAAPELIQSSCCGMAGSFGYEARHYEISMQMAELSLLPRVRNSPDAIIVADGSSCRHQIQDGAQRTAIHVARLLDRLSAPVQY